MKVLHRITLPHNGQLYGYRFWCPGCKESHAIPVEGTSAHGQAGWEFDDNEESPTFLPAILIHQRAVWRPKNVPPGTIPECLSNIRNGQIEFIAGTAHALAGKTVPMVELDENGNPVSKEPTE